MALVRRIGFTRFSRFGANLGRLHVSSAKHTEALDSTDELNITCSDDVSKGDYIVWIDNQGVSHEHIVDDVQREHGEDGTLKTTFTGVNSIAELWDDWTDDKRPSGQVATALQSALNGTRWAVGTCDVTTSASVVLYHQSVRESISDILEAWGGELETAITTNGSAVTARSVCVRRLRGNQQSPKRFTWTKDIKSITRKVASDNPKTRVYGFGKGVETESGAYGRRLTFASINGGRSYVEDAAATKVWGHPGTGGTILPACTSFVDEQCEDAAQLLKETKAYLAEVSEPKVSYEASVIDLYAFGRDWEGVGIGDRVAIIDKGFSEAGVRLTGRVSKLERDLLSGEAEVTFGNLQDSMADMWQSVSQTLKAQSLAAATYDAVAGASVGWLVQLQAALNDQFNAVGTYKVETFELGTIYSNVPLNAKTGLPVRSVSNMWAVNISGRGIRLASSLTSFGQWNWQTFITGASVTADLINAGTMRADRIRAGLLTDNVGRNRWDLTNGTLRTNYMTANNATINGNFTCGDTSNMLKLVSGQIQGWENGSQIGFIDYSGHFRNIDMGEQYRGLQLQAEYGIRMSSLQIAVSTSANTSAVATICYTGKISQPIISEIHDAGNGTVNWHYGTFYLKFTNGLCTSYGTVGTG
ncbi:phage tail protein [Olsenella sp. Marseille-P4559]|uniref:phage tail protein n=1 Tax=Olsenella sp. Marseille-P4559 TaxID=2364795 RepID=UPI0013EEEBC6|nr:phage tail protein [Olsenella sp. Marseille-P4559]